MAIYICNLNGWFSILIVCNLLVQLFKIRSYNDANLLVLLVIAYSYTSVFFREFIKYTACL